MAKTKTDADQALARVREVIGLVNCYQTFVEQPVTDYTNAVEDLRQGRYFEQLGEYDLSVKHAEAALPDAERVLLAYRRVLVPTFDGNLVQATEAQAKEAMRKKHEVWARVMVYAQADVPVGEWDQRLAGMISTFAHCGLWAELYLLANEAYALEEARLVAAIAAVNPGCDAQAVVHDKGTKAELERARKFAHRVLYAVDGYTAGGTRIDRTSVGPFLTRALHFAYVNLYADATRQYTVAATMLNDLLFAATGTRLVDDGTQV